MQPDVAAKLAQPGGVLAGIVEEVRVKNPKQPGCTRHGGHSLTRSPSSSVFTSLINTPAIRPLLLTVAV